MPNGGSDCCGTCWFNRRNAGEKGYSRAGDSEVEAYCEIRDVLIENPFWTYCANHPHRRPQRDPIPIGPIMRAGGGDYQSMGYGREVWVSSPDSEEIRKHLLGLLESLPSHIAADRYPARPGLAEVVVRQLGEFKERRAEKRIQWLSENLPESWAGVAREALANIRAED